MGHACCKCLFGTPEENPVQQPLIVNKIIEAPRKMSIGDFEMKALLGKGAFAKVVLVKLKADNNFYAMKILKKKEISARNEENHIIAERKILENTKSPFIVELRYAFQNSRKLYMVMEFMPGGELFYHLSKARRFNEEIARFYIAEVIIGLEYLHSKGIIYRDLKPENILLGLDGHIKLTDFGLSKIFSDNSFKTRTICGTPEYQAPEIIMDREYDRAVDFWSIGCLLYELILGIPPFYDKQRENLKNRILHENVVFSRIFSEPARNLIDKLLVKNVRVMQPVYRLVEFKRIKEHEFFDGLDWEEVKEKKINPPYKPKQSGDIDNFDTEFTSENPLSANMSPSPQSNLAEFPGFTYTDKALIN